MNKREKLKVYFKLNNQYYVLFNVIQMGANGAVDLKITDFYNNMAILVCNAKDEYNGYLTENEIDKSNVVRRIEMSYHKDGSYLHKFEDKGQIEHANPYGEGIRWTPTDKIVDFQPIFNIEICRMEIYNQPCEKPIVKPTGMVYICENDDLFSSKGTYFAVCFIRNKSFPLCRYTNSDVYSDVITSLNDELDLCIYIQRHSYLNPKPYYSKRFEAMITPYLCNSTSFCDKESSKEEIMDKLKDAVFNPNFSKFLSIITDGNFINLTEDKLQLIDQIEIFCAGKENESLEKPLLIKLALRELGNRLSDFNNFSSLIKQKQIQWWYYKLESELKNKSC